MAAWATSASEDIASVDKKLAKGFDGHQEWVGCVSRIEADTSGLLAAVGVDMSDATPAPGVVVAARTRVIRFGPRQLPYQGCQACPPVGADAAKSTAFRWASTSSLLAVENVAKAVEKDVKRRCGFD